MQNNINQNGQALVALLIFIVMAIAIGTAAAFIIAGNSEGASSVAEGVIARQMADSGIEEAYLEIVRNGVSYLPNPNPEVLNLDGGTVSIKFSWNGSTATIDSIATSGNYVKCVRSLVTANSGMSQISWKEVVNCQ